MHNITGERRPGIPRPSDQWSPMHAPCRASGVENRAESGVPGTPHVVGVAPMVAIPALARTVALQESEGRRGVENTSEPAG